MILSNFRKTRTKDRIESYRIIFENTEKKTANQTVELISDKNKKLKSWNKKRTFSNKFYKERFFIFILK